MSHNPDESIPPDGPRPAGGILFQELATTSSQAAEGLVRRERMMKFARFAGLGLAIGILGVVAVGQGIARKTFEGRYHSSVRYGRQLELQLQDLHGMRGRLTHAFDQEQAHAAQLSRTLSARETTLSRAMQRIAHEELVVRELEGRLAAIEHQFDVLQGELAVALQTAEPSPTTASGQPIRLEKVVVASPGATQQLEGRVLSVHDDWKFVIIDLGWDVVRIGDTVSIYRHDQLLGRARVERVQEAVSAATLLPEWDAAAIKVDDAVRAL